MKAVSDGGWTGIDMCTGMKQQALSLAETI